MTPGLQFHPAGALGYTKGGLLSQGGADEAGDRGLVRKDVDDIFAALDPFVEPIDRIDAVQLGAVLTWEVVEGQDVALGAIHQRHEPEYIGSQLNDHDALLRVGSRCVDFDKCGAGWTSKLNRPKRCGAQYRRHALWRCT